MDDWYENIEIIADEAHRAGKVFWAYSLTASHFSYPVPTLNDMRLQVFSYLIYGAQGLMYFMWSTGNTVDYRSMPVTPWGEKTESYPVMVQINKEIKGLTPVFQGADFLWVKHTGKWIPQGTTRLVGSDLPSTIRSLEISGKGAAVSLIENGDKQYLIILNRNLNFDITFKAEVVSGVKTVAKNGVSKKVGKGLQTITLAPGDIWIYQWNKKNNGKPLSSIAGNNARLKEINNDEMTTTDMVRETVDGKTVYPLGFRAERAGNVTLTQGDGQVTLKTTGFDPWISTTTLGSAIKEGARSVLTFEYKSNKDNSGAFYWCVNGGTQGWKVNIFPLEAASEWKRFEFDLADAANQWKFGVNDSGGQAPAKHFIRFDPGIDTGYEISIRNFQIQVLE
jgi:hypothetical protein